ncbi:glycosyltransferase family 2 protein [Flavobacterium flavipallidum]|uniref:Glycosyltransferase family A protein n=1 Tax=Flavobacterium flavipallidum TaxID=3139140 RepID=A0ABU9HJA8_9FLAO
MNNNLISVIIPVYNVSKYLRQCLDSIINQTYKDLEIILINDGSTDDSLKICQEYELLDSRILLVSQENRGLAASRNKGIQLATAEYLLFVDSDDWLELNTIESVLPFIENSDLVCFSFIKQYEGNKVVRSFEYNGKYDAAFLQRRITGPIKDELHDPSHLETMVTAWGKIYKTSIIKDNNIFAKNINEIGAWEDGLFSWEYLNNAKSVYILDKAFYNYRKFNPISMTSNYKKDFLNKTNFLFDLILTNLKSNNKSEEYYEAFNNRICLSVIGLGLIETYNTTSFFSKIKFIKTVLDSKYHKPAFTKLKLKYFPFHWRVFFFFAKYKMPLPLFLMILMMKKIIKK